MLNSLSWAPASRGSSGIGCSCHWKSYHQCISTFLYCRWNITSTKKDSEYTAKRQGGTFFSTKTLNTLRWSIRFQVSGCCSRQSLVSSSKGSIATIWHSNSEEKLSTVFWRRWMTRLILCLLVSWIWCLLSLVKTGSLPKKCSTVRWEKEPFFISTRSFKTISSGRL